MFWGFDDRFELRDCLLCLLLCCAGSSGAAGEVLCLRLLVSSSCGLVCFG